MNRRERESDRFLPEGCVIWIPAYCSVNAEGARAAGSGPHLAGGPLRPAAGRPPADRRELS
jgi:hypothetical protein